MSTDLGVPLDRLHRRCASDSLGFDTTDAIDPLVGVIGQDSAIEALRFGIAIKQSGYNVFVLGQPGSGRHTFTLQILQDSARTETTPPDRCYVFDFEDPRHPVALSLPPGRGPELRSAMSDLIADLRRMIPRALESETVADRRRALIEERGKAASDLMDELRRALTDDPHVALVGSPEAMAVVPARVGEPLTSKAYEELPPDQRREIDERVRAGAREVFDVQRRIQQIERDARAAVDQFHREVTEGIVTNRTAALTEQFAGVESVLAYLREVERDMVDHLGEFLPKEQTGPLTTLFDASGRDFFVRYGVNPVVTNQPGAGAPVVEESNPHLRNLLGRVEGQMRFGVMTTDFTQIVAGSAQRAIGGYLVLDAEEVLTRPLVWPALKRALRTGELRTADPAVEVGLFAPQSLEPAPIPARFSVVLIGQPRTYYMLQALDGEFDELFKVKVDFWPHMDRTPESEGLYARLIAAECAKRSLPGFNADAVGRLIEEGSREAGDQMKLSTRFRPLLDLVTESAHYADPGGAVPAEAVDRAIHARERRSARPQEELLELIERGVLKFDPVGAAVGQVHGIALLAAGERWYGRPIRVMASAFFGSSGVIQIEREAQLSGPIHNKGFLVLSGYLGREFAREHPLILSASVSFDQLYEEVEGDSASAAELYALLSAIGEVPLAQGLAVTGAVNQDGVILPVGGVTQKIEGFYAACERVGADGPRGVIVPRRNLHNLVLRREIEDAVRQGRFSLYAIDRIEEGWEILSGLPAGARTLDGSFPEGTVYRRVQERLAAWARHSMQPRSGPEAETGAERG